MGNKRSKNNNSGKKALKGAVKLILVIVLWSQSVFGRSTRCALMQNFLKYYPDDPEAQTECIACPECPPGLGLVPQCGSKITNYTTIKCEPCQLNKTFSDNHGFESCRSCHDCGLKNVIQQCTPSQNRKCGTKCPERHYLDDNGFCQECYFCCPSVDETGRMKKCKEIGMGEDWQCLKNHQNKLCKEALENSTEASVDTTYVTAVTLLHGHNFEANKTESTSSDNVRKPTASSENVRSNGNITPSIIVGMIIACILVLIFVLYVIKRIISCRNGSTLYSEGLHEHMPLHGIRSEGRKDNGGTVHDNREDELEQFLLRQPMNNRPNIGLIPTDAQAADDYKEPHTNELRQDQTKTDLIPADCKVSEMPQLRNHENQITENSPSCSLLDFKLADFPYDVEDFILQLDSDSSLVQKNWRHVAHRFEISKQDIQLLETESRKPGVSAIRLLIEKLCSFKCTTLKEFVEVLQELERNDVANDIISWFRQKQDRCSEEGKN